VVPQRIWLRRARSPLCTGADVVSVVRDAGTKASLPELVIARECAPAAYEARAGALSPNPAWKRANPLFARHGFVVVTALDPLRHVPWAAPTA
jgi:hypothetical protein